VSEHVVNQSIHMVYLPRDIRHFLAAISDGCDVQVTPYSPANPNDLNNPNNSGNSDNPLLERLVSLVLYYAFLSDNINMKLYNPCVICMCV